ncbi:hypothetical protein Vadar_024414 [Vaccinium darrowii]|uniref:Uncharacterized protein n=1 Tax=Vaccinium darrowii TaxID=229202 RepID=A0ACB7XKF6_9ERIC|nr:hypothetical protein Vadar_024414 [Vaccinium darrowii]
MLDLNIDLVDNSSCDIEHETKMTTTTEEKATECDDSGSSSVVEVLSSDRSSIPLSLSLFDFGILSKGKGLRIEEDCGEDSTTPLLVTRQLFPVARGSGVGDSSSESKSLLRPQWLNLSGSGSDQMIKFQKKQQQQVVKKSRRGPRSRSSQYRGVTFYRRTGRWESHIWYPFCLVVFK